MTAPPSDKDSLYKAGGEPLTPFTFDRRVAQVFPDMIRRSVPGYATVINMLGVLAARYVQDHSHCYDLGCSLGAASVAMAQGIRAKHCRVIGIDNSAEMLRQAKGQIGRHVWSTPIELQCADATVAKIENASMVVLNFTLQFIPIPERLALLQRVRQGLRPGGILVLSEKITFEDAQREALQIEMHHAFKRANGYDELEISRKRDALENVLLPETLATHQARLQAAGFLRSDLWFQCFNFVSMVARV